MVGVARKNTNKKPARMASVFAKKSKSVIFKRVYNCKFWGEMQLLVAKP
jgi:hypothetical protein